ncbi:NAD(P)-binding protein [Aspergillus pseudoustus]|uniref:NAD(P)-binding protein n=1 Tax=Aspergillus pseudoustus TaxID=1810923 RepID=A0ABR4KH52_9EURO
MSPKIVLITGANRGIGRGLLELYLAKPNHLVIAANRNAEDPTSKEILSLPTAEGSSAKLVQLDMTSLTEATDAAKTLTDQGIDHIDILIANAGVATVFQTLGEVQIEDVRAHFETNVCGFVRVYQAFLGLLKAAKEPRLVTIGSSAAFLTCRNMIAYPNAAYAPTKLVQHWYTKTVALQEPWLTAFPVDPGFVQTNIGNRAAGLIGLEKASITVEESAAGVLNVIDASTQETHSGKLWKWTGEEEPW